ncbi:MAG: hypothetical protein J3K34DRAFT_431120 [Monoraphidium minutum]|nr:MAG: hypothetical protein J3K34DRAFT_431120 [Monoraphidium minutum]
MVAAPSSGRSATFRPPVWMALALRLLSLSWTDDCLRAGAPTCTWRLRRSRARHPAPLLAPRHSSYLVAAPQRRRPPSLPRRGRTSGGV